MRLIDADELMEHAWRDKLDSRELIAKMIEQAPTVKEIPTKIPIDIFEKLVSREPCDAPDINDGDIYECHCGYGWDKSKVVRHHFCPNCGRAVNSSYNSIKPELKPCEDAISRQAVLDLVADYDLSMGQVVKGIHTLPSVKLQEPCEDAISRQKAIDAIDALYLDGDSPASYLANAEGDTLIGKYQAITALEDLPSVTTAQKIGHWIFDEILDKHYYCSECKSMGVDYWDYCPYCGAKMFEPQESGE